MEQKSHWAGVIYRMDRWTNISISTHMLYKQVNTWHMYIEDIMPIMYKKIGHEACNIYKWFMMHMICNWVMCKWYNLQTLSLPITCAQIDWNNHTIWTCDMWITCKEKVLWKHIAIYKGALKRITLTCKHSMILCNMWLNNPQIINDIQINKL